MRTGQRSPGGALPSPARGAVAVVLATAGLAALAGCGGGGDTPDVAAQLNAQVARQVGLSPGKVHTTCPATAEVEDGAAFDCEVRIGEARLTANVSVGEGKRLDYRLGGTVVPTADLVSAAKSDVLAKLHIEVAQLDCGADGDVVVIPDGGTVDCHGTSTTGDPGVVRMGLDGAGKPVVVEIGNAGSTSAGGTATQSGSGQPLPVAP